MARAEFLRCPRVKIPYWKGEQDLYRLRSESHICNSEAHQEAFRARENWQGICVDEEMSLTTDEDKTQWLRSPLQQQSLYLQPMREISFQPYFGPKKTLRLHRTQLVLGSADDCDVPIDDPFVSPRHAELWVAGGAYLVSDLGSRNEIGRAHV